MYPMLGPWGPNKTSVLLGWDAKHGQEGTGHSAVQHTGPWEMPKHIKEEWSWVARDSSEGNQAEPYSRNTTCAPGKLSIQHLTGREAHPTVDREGNSSGLSPTEYREMASTSSTNQPIPNLFQLPTHAQVSFCFWLPPWPLQTSTESSLSSWAPANPTRDPEGQAPFLGILCRFHWGHWGGWYILPQAWLGLS